MGIRESDSPFIPYTGSKRADRVRVVAALRKGRRLLSPFCGMAAAEMEALRVGAFEEATLCDVSPYVVAVLRGIRDDPREVHRESLALAEHIQRAIKVGEWDHRAAQEAAAIGVMSGGLTEVEAAGSLLALNAFTFSNHWRTNAGWVLNAACDERGRPIRSLKALRQMSEVLRRCRIVQAPWQSIDLFEEDADAIYVDPPYLGKGGFRSYGAGGWSREEARALALRIAKSPCRIVVSEQDPGGAQLYEDALGVTGARWAKTRRFRGDRGQEKHEVLIVREA